MRRLICLVLTAAAIAGSALGQTKPAGNVEPLKIGPSAYERMDPTRLADQLSQMGLGRLLRIYGQEVAKTSPLDAKYIQGELLVMQAREEIGDPVKYSQLMDQAVAIFREVVAGAARPADPYASLRALRYRLHLADVLGNAQIEPYIAKLLYLHAGDEDRKFVVDKTAESMKMFVTLQSNVRDKNADLATDTTARMAIGPDLEKLEEAMLWKSGLAALYRGMAMPEGRDKQTCLMNVVTAMEKFVQDAENETGLRYDAHLRSGQASRERKEHQRALEMLKVAASDQAEAEVRIRAEFEIARCLAEKGDFEAAKTQVNKFHENARKFFGEKRKVAADVQYAFLKSYLYEVWSESVKKDDAAKADQLAAEATKAMIEFVTAYPEEAGAFYDKIADRYPEPKTADKAARAEYLKKLNSMVLLAYINKQVTKYQDQADKWPEVEKQAIEDLGIILAREDAASMQVRPMALFTKGYIHARALRNIDAAHAFLEVPRKHADHLMALNALDNAIICLNNIIQERIENKQIVRPDLRDLLLEAYRLLYGKKEWADSPKGKANRYGYGFQAYKRAEGLDLDAVNGGGATSPAPTAGTAPAGQPSRKALLKEAIAAFEGLSPEQADYMDGRFMAIHCRQMLLQLPEADKAAQKAAGNELVKVAQAYIADAGRLGPQLAAAKKEHDAKAVREWAASADAIVARANFEVLENKAAAIAQLEGMADKWAGTNAAKQAAQMRIQFLLLDNKTGEAVKLVQDFKTKYPTEGAGLIAMVIEQLKMQIKQLRNDPRQQAALNSYRKAYYEFAKDLHEGQKKSNPSMDQLYEYEQMRGSAALEKGIALESENQAAEAAKLMTEALETFERCKKHDDGKREIAGKALEAKFAGTVETLKRKGITADVIIAAAENLVKKDLPAAGVDPKNSAAAMSVNMYLTAYRKAVEQGSDARTLEKNIEHLRQVCLVCCDKTIASLKKGLPVDPVNLWGLARANAAAKKLGESLRIYKLLTEGISKETSPADYWQAEIEYCETAILYIAADPQKNAQSAKALAARVKQLRADDPNLGGFVSRFGAVEAQAMRMGGS